MHHDVLIVGGGNAGISLAARLLKDGVSDVALVESESVHRYRPLLNYVGSGEATMSSLERPASSVVPQGCTWIQDRVVAVDPQEPSVTTETGRRISCSTLVLCPGLDEDWDATPGLREAYASGRAGSTFLVETASEVWAALRDLKDGRVVFTMPPEPAPCGATALKPLLMACDHWQRTGVLADLDVILVLPGSSPLDVPAADVRLEAILSSYGVEVLRSAHVVDVGDGRLIVRMPDGDRQLDEVTYAHVVPHYRAPQWIAEAGLAGPTGLVDIDPETLQHLRHPSIWAIGDAADVATRPSGGALRKQVDVLAHNLTRTGDAPKRYDGYTVMPITTSRHRLMLVEVDRAGKLTPTVPFPDLIRPRGLTWWLDRYALPQTYYRRILRGKV